MKKTISILIALVLVFAMAPAVFAESPAPGGPFNTAFRVQNLEDTTASCTYAFYNAAGTAVLESTPQSVAPGDSLYVYVPLLDTLPAGSYSAVVSCDKKVAAVVNFSDPNSGASHSGISEPGDTWYAPGIYDNYYGYYSNIYVQNATASAVDITVDIFAPGSDTPVYSSTEANVPGYAAVTFEQEGLAQLADNQFYSAKISATGDVAPIVNIYGRGAVDDQLYSYNPFKAGSMVAYAPIIMNNYYGYNTALVIQNMGAANAAVTVDYTTGTTTNHTIAPGAAVSLYTPTVVGLPEGNTALLGAKVTSDQEIAVLVNQSNVYQRAASYVGFAAGTVEVRAPIVEKNYYTYNSSVVCQNVGDAAATMTITYTGPGVGAPTTSPSVPPEGIHQFYQPIDPSLVGVPINWIGSAVIESAQPIVCVVNQDVDTPYATIVQDTLYSYEGIAP
jgi:hypothetical protein